MELRHEYAPFTAENFRALCTGEKGFGARGMPLHYKGTFFHAVSRQWRTLYGGDIIAGDGSGGESIYGSVFDDEDFSLTHNRPGILSMVSTYPNTNNSQLSITMAPAPWLDGQQVVFGEVTDGMDVLERILADDTGHPVVIVNSGELVVRCEF